MSAERNQEDYIRGQQAEAVLNSEAYKRAIEAIERKLFDDFKKSTWLEGRLRNEIHRRLKTVSWFEEILNREMQDGKLAKKRLEAK